MSRNPLIIFIHGKWSRPDTYIFTALEKKLISENYHVKKLDMPWSTNRNYDQSYPDALSDLSNKIKQYRQQGFQKIVLIGHSLGANASFAYQAEYNNADAIVAITPGHTPEALSNNKKYQQWLQIAENIIKKKLKNTLIKFIDVNCGSKKLVETMTDIFYSYYHPQGLGNMPKSVLRIKKNIPVLYIEGVNDSVRTGPDYIFFRLPEHPYNGYKLVESNHIDCAKVSKDLIVEWLNNLKFNNLL